MIISVLILILLFIAYFSNGNSSAVPSNSTIENKDSHSDITIQSSMILSNNDLFPINREHKYLRLKMVKGKNLEDVFKWDGREFIKN